jgi:acetylornithine/succinyldiaminopimelate/putrescine aminotransferase
LEQVFFCNSGAEANENAIGLARRHTGRRLIVSLRGGWHGRTVATLAVTDGAKYEEAAARAGVPLSRKVAPDDVAELEAAVSDSVAAVILDRCRGWRARAIECGVRASGPANLRSSRCAADLR